MTTLRVPHTGLVVTDLDRSIGFYRDVLGIDCYKEPTVVVQRPGTGHRGRPPRPPAETGAPPSGSAPPAPPSCWSTAPRLGRHAPDPEQPARRSGRLLQAPYGC